MDNPNGFMHLLVDQLVNDGRLVEKLIPSLRERVESSPQQRDRWLSVSEAAAHMGISTDLVYIMVREGTIKCARLGQLNSRKPTIRFKQSELDAWLEAGGVAGNGGGENG